MRFKIASIVSLAVLASVASADPNYPYWDLTNTLKFSVDQGLADQGVVVTNIIGYMEGGFVGLPGPARWSSYTWAYRSDRTSSIPMYFTTKYSGSELPEPRILQTTLIGLIEGALPGDTSGATKHVVLFMNDAAKAGSVGQS